MKTTIDIPDEMLKETIKHARASTKREAVLAALADYNRRHSQAELIRYLGTFKDFIAPRELSELRSERTKRHGSH